LIWGAGAIGGTIGTYLARAGLPVLMVDLVSDHVDAMNENGLSIRGQINELATPSAPIFGDFYGTSSPIVHYSGQTPSPTQN
jgi:2-dehydropantoate 2-reductase